MARACLVCGSRKWRKDGVTGNAICEDGHVYQDFRSENLVLEPTTATLQRRVDKTRRARGPSKRSLGHANPDYYHGVNAAWLKVQALQVMLRAQTQALQKLWSLPDVYESIVRDIWAYQLSRCTLPSRPSANPSGEHTIDIEPTGQAEGTAGLDDAESDSSSSSSSSSSGEMDNIDPSLLEDIERLSDEEERLSENDSRNKKKGKKKKALRASDTVVCLAVGLWVIRYPFLHVDLENAINANAIPYIDFGRSILLPEDMRKRINLEVILALCPPKAPTPLFLHHQCHVLVRHMSTQFGILVPEINLPPLAWRIIAALGATPTVYAQVTRLMALIDVNLSLDNSEVVTRWRRRRKAVINDGGPEREMYDRTTRNEDVWMPELAVVAAWIIVMKMTYGLDGRPRLALSRNDPAIGLPGGRRWIDELRKRLKNGSYKGDRANMGRIDFITMDPTDMDHFLDQAEGVLLKDRPTLRVDDLFPPLPPGNNPPVASLNVHWDAYHSSLQPITHATVSSETANQDLPLEPGEKVRSYDATDITGTLPTDYEVVMNAASDLVGVRPRDVAKMVEVLERRLIKARPTRSRTPSRSGSLRRTMSGTLA